MWRNARHPLARLVGCQMGTGVEREFWAEVDRERLERRRGRAAVRLARERVRAQVAALELRMTVDD